MKRVARFMFVVAVPVVLGYMVLAWDWVLTAYESLRGGGLGLE